MVSEQTLMQKHFTATLCFSDSLSLEVQKNDWQSSGHSEVSLHHADRETVTDPVRLTRTQATETQPQRQSALRPREAQEDEN